MKKSKKKIDMEVKDIIKPFIGCKSSLKNFEKSKKDTG